MTNEETLCTFMDPAPRRGHPNNWWWLQTELGPGWDTWKPREIWTLDILREVEEKLDDRQWTRYEDLLCFNHPQGCNTRRKIHADVRQKLDALATAIGMPLLRWNGMKWLVDEKAVTGCFCGDVIPGACRGFGPEHEERMKDFLCR
jgi:hypothetical protein